MWYLVFSSSRLAGIAHLDHVLEDVSMDGLVVNILRMLSGDDNRVYADGLMLGIVFDCDLGICRRDGGSEAVRSCGLRKADA